MRHNLGRGCFQPGHQETVRQATGDTLRARNSPTDCVWQDKINVSSPAALPNRAAYALQNNQE